MLVSGKPPRRFKFGAHSWQQEFGIGTFHFSDTQSTKIGFARLSFTDGYNYVAGTGVFPLAPTQLYRHYGNVDITQAHRHTHRRTEWADEEEPST